MKALRRKAKCVGIEQVFNILVKQLGSPVDFELPESLNKSKPLPYNSIRKNIYLTKKIKRRLEDDVIFCLCSTSAGASGVCGKDCLCGMLRSSCTAGCKCGSSCMNKPFHQRIMKKMKVVRTDKCGLGVVAEEDIEKGEFVIEYVGEVIDDKTCEIHKSQLAAQMQKWMIDGETRIGSIFATRNIRKGEHLTYDYQFVQFGRRKLGVKQVAADSH